MVCEKKNLKKSLFLIVGFIRSKCIIFTFLMSLLLSPRFFLNFPYTPPPPPQLPTFDFNLKFPGEPKKKFAKKYKQSIFSVFAFIEVYCFIKLSAGIFAVFITPTPPPPPHILGTLGCVFTKLVIHPK